LIECQHCGASAEPTRTYCPTCRRRLRPAVQAQAAAEVAPIVAAAAPPPLPSLSLPLPPPLPSAEHASGACSVCGEGPAASGSFVAVRSYVLFFRRSRREGTWCRDCALTQFREMQFVCMTRGWWGFLYCPAVNLISIIGNLVGWSRFRSMAPAQRSGVAPAPSKPLRRRPLAYLTTALAATIVVIVAITPSGKPVTVQTAARRVSGPTHDHFKPLTEFLARAPSGWALGGHDVPISIKLLSKNFKQPSLVEGHLATDGFLRGLYREYFQSTPRKVVGLELWQFATPAGADAFLAEFVRSNAPSSNEIYRKEFLAPRDGHGYLSAHRDKYGFYFGVGVRRIGDLIVHVRFGSLSAVSVTDLKGALEWTSAAVTLVSTA